MARLRGVGVRRELEEGAAGRGAGRRRGLCGCPSSRWYSQMPRLCKLGGLVLAWLFATVQSLPAYYLNMDDLTERARLMDTHLRELGFTDPP